MPRGAVGRLPLPTMAAAPLLVIAGALGGTARALCWIGASTCFFSGIPHLALRGV
jgi:hypothetical protein